MDMLQTMLVTGVTALQDKNEINHWENRPFVGSWPDATQPINQKPDITRNRVIKKKQKRLRTVFTTKQLRALEKTFLMNKYITSDYRRELSKELSIGEKSIKIWFQNRRMKEKRESSEASDSSNESIGQEVRSPPSAVKSDSEIENSTQYNNQLPSLDPYYVNYQLPTSQAFCMDTNEVYEPQNNVFTSNNISFSHDANPYPTQYYPSGEAEAYLTNFYQNHCQENNEIYNYWCQNNMGYYNYCQY